jgi:hypothetical protein
MNTRIYIVGFPKSGNTWLTRLVADALDAPAGSGMGIEDKNEIASYVDSNRKQNSNIKVLKTHFLPDKHLELEKGNHHVIYIFRDFRDVLISAFFYKNAKVSEDLSKLLTTKQFLNLKIGSKIKFVQNRNKFYNFAKNLCKTWSTDVGSWSENIKEWRSINNENILSKSFTTYEKLLSNPEKELEKIFNNIKLNVDKSRIKEAINNQSFKTKIEKIEKEDNEIPLGKDFNKRFMRKGKSGDWVNFLTKKIATLIESSNGVMMGELGYTQSDWEDNLPSNPITN